MGARLPVGRAHFGVRWTSGEHPQLGRAGPAHDAVELGPVVLATDPFDVVPLDVHAIHEAPTSSTAVQAVARRAASDVVRSTAVPPMPNCVNGRGSAVAAGGAQAVAATSAQAPTTARAPTSPPAARRRVCLFRPNIRPPA